MKYVFVGFLLLALNSEAQTNLVPNSSFEDYTQCPWSQNVFFPFVPPWFNPVTSGPSYFNACNNDIDSCYVGVPCNVIGYQEARSGNAYIGISLHLNPDFGIENGRMYVEVKLNQPLEEDTLYYIDFFVSNSGWGESCAVANVGMYLSVDSIYSNNNDTLGYIPQIASDPTIIINDTVSWIQISGLYQAQGGEQFITIGNFLADDQTNFTPCALEAYYYIDDVLVTKCSEYNSVNDLVKAEKLSLSIYPNPTKSFSILKWNPQNGRGVVSIYNLLGVELQSTNINLSNGEYQINSESFPSGIYYVKLRVENGYAKTLPFSIIK